MSSASPTSAARSTWAPTARARSWPRWSAGGPTSRPAVPCSMCTATTTTSSRPTRPTSGSSAATTSTPSTCANTGAACSPHQTPNYIARISDYFQELDIAARIIRAEEGHDRLVVSGHSTGGLITSLWAHARRDDAIVDGLFLNSPFFEFNLPPLTRRAAGSTLSALARAKPMAKIAMGGGTYGRSLHSDHLGEWTFDTAWKPIARVPGPVRLGRCHPPRPGTSAGRSRDHRTDPGRRLATQLQAGQVE